MLNVLCTAISLLQSFSSRLHTHISLPFNFIFTYSSSIHLLVKINDSTHPSTHSLSKSLYICMHVPATSIITDIDAIWYLSVLWRSYVYTCRFIDWLNSVLELTLEIRGNFEIWNDRKVTRHLHLPDYKRDVCCPDEKYRRETDCITTVQLVFDREISNRERKSFPGIYVDK